jgi:hypothetical protein
MAEWHYTVNGQPAAAPVSDDQLKQLAASGRLRPSDMVWKDGMANWASASSIPGLFGGASAPAPSPRSAPGPMAVAPADEYHAGPVGGGSATLDIGLDLKRAYSWDLHETPVSEAEQAALAANGVTGEVGQKYLAWRRSLLWLTAVPAVLAALVGLINEIMWMTGSWLPLSGLGILAHLVRLLALLLLPAVAVLGALNWAKPALSKRLVLGGWGLVVLFLFFFTIVPWTSQVSFDQSRSIKTPKSIEEAKAMEEASKAQHAAAILGAVLLLFLSLPFYLALVPGTLRAAAMVKTLVPESSVPGPALVWLALPYVLLFLLGGVGTLLGMSPLIGVAVLLFSAAPLIYVIRAGLFLRIGATPDDRKGMALAQLIYLGVSGLGVLLILVSAIAAAGAGLILTLFEWGMDYITFSMLTTVVVADWLVSTAVSTWRQQEELAKSPEAANADQRINGLGTISGQP